MYLAARSEFNGSVEILFYLFIILGAVVATYTREKLRFMGNHGNHGNFHKYSMAIFMAILYAVTIASGCTCIVTTDISL